MNIIYCMKNLKKEKKRQQTQDKIAKDIIQLFNRNFSYF